MSFVRQRIVVIDTSIFCCWLKVPGKEEAGSGEGRWDFKRANDFIDNEVRCGSTLVLPLATVIEAGNHIAQCSGDRYKLAEDLVGSLRRASSACSPWASFHEQSVLWDEDGVSFLAKEWPGLAAAKISIGDATIKAVAEYYARAGFDVVILTGDNGLKSYEPIAKPMMPRRRGGK